MSSFINPIIPMQTFAQTQGAAAAPAGGAGSIFSEIFGNAIRNVTETQNQVSEDLYNLSTGQLQSDDLHTLQINMERAELSLQVLVQLRNSVLDAYTELMRISL